MRGPSFLVVGAQKAGTTWLYGMLREHPEVFVTQPKSLYFFSNPQVYAKGLGWYREHFRGGRGYPAAGEFTPNYFWEEPGASFDDGSNVPERVQRAYPDARIIVTLREPVDRAVSAYYHHIRAGRVQPRQQLRDVRGQHGILSMGFYDEHLERWQACFSEQQLLVLIYETEIAKNREETLRRVFRFLDVRESRAPEATGRRFNSRGSHLQLRLSGRAPLLAKAANLVLPSAIKNHDRFAIPVSEEEREELAEIYQPHNRRLAELLGRDLPWSSA